MYIQKLKIGNVELENNILLAPMAGITDLPFRTICKKYSNPGLVCTEMRYFIMTKRQRNL